MVCCGRIPIKVDSRRQKTLPTSVMGKEQPLKWPFSTWERAKIIGTIKIVEFELQFWYLKGTIELINEFYEHFDLENFRSIYVKQLKLEYKVEFGHLTLNTSEIWKSTTERMRATRNWYQVLPGRQLVYFHLLFDIFKNFGTNFIFTPKPTNFRFDSVELEVDRSL